MYPHRIRLRGPWDCEPLARQVIRADGSVDWKTSDLPPAFRMTMPAPWNQGGLSSFTGRMRLSRRFGFPRRLDEHERVWLMFAGITGSAKVSLNGHCLGGQLESDRAFEFEITSLLQERNRLVVDGESATPDGGIWGEVALEIRCTAFLHDVEIEARDEGGQVELQVRGAVVGTSARPLEVYVLAGCSTIAYARVEPGRSFVLLSERLPQERWQQTGEVRVELVEGATVWYGIDRAIAH
jgi:hypothetical protein